MRSIFGVFSLSVLYSNALTIFLIFSEPNGHERPHEHIHTAVGVDPRHISRGTDSCKVYYDAPQKPCVETVKTETLTIWLTIYMWTIQSTVKNLASSARRP